MDPKEQNSKPRLSPSSRRILDAAGVIGFYVVLMIAIFAPLASPIVPHTGAEDLANHIGGIVEARNALEEGQFPVRVAPNQLFCQRYPIFQFYGNFPYTLGGLIYKLEGNPYFAWKLVMGGSLVFGAFFIYLECRRMTRRHWPALLAGAIFLTAPYTLCDIHGRTAFPETVSLGMLPVVWHLLQRTLRRPRLGLVLLGGVSWSLLALSHSITFMCASALFGLYVLSCGSFSRKFLIRGLALLGGYLLGVGLTAWYMAPQLILLPDLVGGLKSRMIGTAFLTPAGVMLAPTVVPPIHVPTGIIHSPMHFAMQIGWPILAALVVACHGLMAGRPGWRLIRGRTWRLIVLLVISIFMVWSPFNFWQYMPEKALYIQFTYRLLLFVVLFGSLLSGVALKSLFHDRLAFEHAVGVIVVLGLYLGEHLKPHQSPDPQIDLAKEIETPNIGRGGANGVYLLALNRIHDHMRAQPCPPGFVPVWRYDAPLDRMPPRPPSSRLFVESPGNCFVQVPVLFYPGMLDVKVDGRKAPYYSMGYTIGLAMTQGTHQVDVKFVGLRWANHLSLGLWILTLAAGGVLVGRSGCARFRTVFRKNSPDGTTLLARAKDARQAA